MGGLLKSGPWANHVPELAVTGDNNNNNNVVALSSPSPSLSSVQATASFQEWSGDNKAATRQ
jgi:hypothetical protein